jgi:flavin-dependent dehydrogenase
MPDIENYDVVVVGSGEAGKYVGWTMAARGHRTAVVERKLIGGSCDEILGFTAFGAARRDLHPPHGCRRPDHPAERHAAPATMTGAEDEHAQDGERGQDGGDRPPLGAGFRRGPSDAWMAR